MATDRNELGNSLEHLAVVKITVVCSNLVWNYIGRSLRSLWDCLFAVFY